MEESEREINWKISDFAIPPSAIFSLPLQQLAGQKGSGMYKQLLF